MSLPFSFVNRKGHVYVLADSRRLTLVTFGMKYPYLLKFYKSTKRLVTLKTALGRGHTHAVCTLGPHKHWWNMQTGASVIISFHHEGPEAPTVYDLPCPRHYEFADDSYPVKI